MEATVYGIDFLNFRIRDYDSNKVIFEVSTLGSVSHPQHLHPTHTSHADLLPQSIPGCATRSVNFALATHLMLHASISRLLAQASTPALT